MAKTGLTANRPLGVQCLRQQVSPARKGWIGQKGLQRSTRMLIGGRGEALNHASH